ncbi:hypothetical protein BDC45DRAFT_542100 [Circinella umbellata]|nr:hypothetical protein BDC45DRAFT_542100 [Circinella umbellata]
MVLGSTNRNMPKRRGSNISVKAALAQQQQQQQQQLKRALVYFDNYENNQQKQSFQIKLDNYVVGDNKLQNDILQNVLAMATTKDSTTLYPCPYLICKSLIVVKKRIHSYIDIPKVKFHNQTDYVLNYFSEVGNMSSSEGCKMVVMFHYKIK